MEIELLWPCDMAAAVITCDFKCHDDRPGYNKNERGLDIGSYGQAKIPLTAVNNGKVIIAGWDNTGYGNTVIVDHYYYQVRFGHMNAIMCNVGDFVKAGSFVGIMGTTGNSSGVHVHMSVYQKRKAIDPLPHMTKKLNNPVDPILFTGEVDFFTFPDILKELCERPKIKVVTTTRLRIRADYRSKSSTVGWLDPGTILDVVDVVVAGKDVWIKIGYNQYVAMYVLGDVYSKILQ